MSMRYPGGFIASTPVTANYPSGVWTQAQAIPYQAQNVWTRDQYWPYTTLLLQGNGTNGAQNNTFLDSSTNNFTITRNGNTTQGSFTPYEANGYWSNYFDGAGDYLSLGGQSAFTFGTGDFTIEFWVYLNSTTANLSDFRPASTNGVYPAIYVTSGSLRYFVDSADRITSSTNLTVGVWYHVALSRSGTSTRLFLNGVQEGSTYTDSNNYLVGANRPTIGISGFDAAGNPLNGYLSNYRIVKGTAVYTSNFTPSAAPLTAITNTSLLTCQSNRFIDNSTNAFAITRNGDVSVQAFQPFPGATTYSGTVLGGSAYLDGSGDYLLTTGAGALAIGTSAFTLEGWVYFNNVNTEGAGFGTCAVAADASTDRGVSLFITNPSGTWRFRIGRSFAGQFEDFLGTTTLTSGQWYHFKIVRTSTATNDTRVYLNGVQEAIGTSTISLNMQKFSIGTYAPSDTTVALLNGYAAGVRFTNTAVSSAVPTSPVTAISGTQYLANFTNAGIFDAAVMNDLETVGNAQVSTSVVKYGTGSMAFDGTDDRLTAPASVNMAFGSGDFTIEGWFYTGTPSSNRGLFQISGTAGGLQANNLNNTAVYCNSSVLGAYYGGTFKAGTTPIVANTWTHFALVRNNSVTRLYVNGVADSGFGANSDTQNYTGQNLCVGGYFSTSYLWNGNIDDFRVTKGAARYITNFTPPPARMPGQ